MWPWSHAAIGYVLYSVYSRTRFRHPPGDDVVLAVLFGTQFPDLIDKPLAWSLGILPSGRSLAHSLLTATVLLTLLWVVTRTRRERRLVAAFGLGYLSHLAADLPSDVLRGDFTYATFLLWPVLPGADDDLSLSFLSHFSGFELTTRTAIGFLFVAAGAILWLADGRPPLGAAKRAVLRVREKLAA